MLQFYFNWNCANIYFLWFNFFHLYLTASVCAVSEHECHVMHVEARGQLRVQSSPTGWVLGRELRALVQAWQQALCPTEPAHWPSFSHCNNRRTRLCGKDTEYIHHVMLAIMANSRTCSSPTYPQIPIPKASTSSPRPWQALSCFLLLWNQLLHVFLLKWNYTIVCGHCVWLLLLNNISKVHL